MTYESEADDSYCEDTNAVELTYMVIDVYRVNPTNTFWEPNLGTTFKFSVDNLVDNYDTFNICPYLASNVNTNHELGPEREAFFAANIGLEFEGFCDYHKAIYNVTLELLYFTNNFNETMLWNENTTLADAVNGVTTAQFNEFSSPDFLKGTTDGNI